MGGGGISTVVIVVASAACMLVERIGESSGSSRSEDSTLLRVSGKESGVAKY